MNKKMIVFFACLVLIVPVLSVIASDNQPPTAPKITGETNGKTGEEYWYNIMSTDSDGDVIYYYFEWGDDQVEDWFGPWQSEEVTKASHKWNNQGAYTIRAKAIDDPNGDGDLSDGAESDWGTLEVSMPKNKVFNLFLRFLEQHPYIFPMLAHLLGL